MKIKAWESDEAKGNAGRYSRPYLDRPVAEASWEKLTDTPIAGLCVYQTEDPLSSSQRTDNTPEKPHPDESEDTSPSETSPPRPPDQLEMRF